MYIFVINKSNLFKIKYKGFQNKIRDSDFCISEWRPYVNMITDTLVKALARREYA